MPSWVLHTPKVDEQAWECRVKDCSDVVKQAPAQPAPVPRFDAANRLHAGIPQLLAEAEQVASLVTPAGGFPVDPPAHFIRAVKWHDGRDFTAGDVKFTFDYALKGHSRSGFGITRWGSSSASDPATFRPSSTQAASTRPTSESAGPQPDDLEDEGEHRLLQARLDAAAAVVFAPLSAKRT